MIILLVATVISVVEWLLQDPRESALPYEAIVILRIVVLNALLGFFQESRAERSVRALMALAAPESTVVRDGERQRIAADEIVPGDIVLIEAGDQDPGGRPHHRECKSPHRRGAIDRRKRAGGEGNCSRSTAISASATAATCCSRARSPHTAVVGPWSSRPEWRPRLAASPACWKPPKRSRRRCNRSSTAPASA